MKNSNSDELLIKSREIKQAALVFRAINNHIRLQILEILHQHVQLTVTELFQKMHMDQSATSQQLGILRNAGLVLSDRKGKRIYYSVAYDRLEQMRQCTTGLVHVM